MSWQDWILSVGNWIFFIALLPSIFSKDKPALSTSLVTGTVLSIFAITFWTLDLRITALSASLTGIAWLVLATQKVLNKKGGTNGQP